MVTAATQQEHNRISSSPVQNHESNLKLNDNEAGCLAIVITLPNVDSHISMILLFLLVPGQGMVRVPLRHGYGTWENKDKFQNGDHNDRDRKYKDCLDDYHEENNTIDRPWLNLVYSMTLSTPVDTYSYACHHITI
jgi:hypothetical protein